MKQGGQQNKWNKDGSSTAREQVVLKYVGRVQFFTWRHGRFGTVGCAEAIWAQSEAEAERTGCGKEENGDRETV